MPATDLDQIVNLCKRRGFVYPSAEIYGGFRSSYDYGPLGSLMLRNVKDAWVRSMVQLRDDVVLIDAAILGPPAIWEASGHLANVHRPAGRLQGLPEPVPGGRAHDPDVCPSCGAKGSFTEARAFNLMFKTYAGPVEGAGAEVYLRPETAQGMFVNFANVLQTSRKKPPFGIAQVGKSFRNEITPGNFIFRTREFEQMEMEFFVPPEDGPKWYEYWCAERFAWYVELGIPADMLRLRPHEDDELSHYSAGTSDVEFLFPWGWGELEGIAQRTDYDLTQHAKHSGEKLEYFDQASGRALRALRDRARGRRQPDDGGVPARRLRRGRDRRRGPHRAAAPPPAWRRTRSRCSRCPRKDTLPPTAREVHRLLSERWMVDFDDTQSIGRRYRRQDEVGTPLLRDGRLRDARRPGRHHPRARHHRAGPGPARRPGRRAVGPPRPVASRPPQPAGQRGRRLALSRGGTRSGSARTSGEGADQRPRAVQGEVPRPDGRVPRAAPGPHALELREVGGHVEVGGEPLVALAHRASQAGSRTSQTVRPRRAVGKSNCTTVRRSGSSSSTRARLTRHIIWAPSS